MKKHFVPLLIIPLLFSLTACGANVGSSGDSKPADEKEVSASYGDSGDSSQDEISTDEDVAESESDSGSQDTWDGEEDTEDSNATDDNVDTTAPSGEDTYIAAENFYQGDGYFDLEEFLWRNGASEVFATDGTDYKKVSSGIGGYVARFPSGWEIYIWTDSGLSVEEYDKNDPWAMQYPAYNVSPDPGTENNYLVTVDSKGSTLYKSNVDHLDVAVKCLHNNPALGEDPLVGSGLLYSTFD